MDTFRATLLLLLLIEFTLHGLQSSKYCLMYGYLYIAAYYYGPWSPRTWSFRTWSLGTGHLFSYFSPQWLLNV